MLVMGLESSCDDSAVALYDGGQGLLAHARHSQHQVHRQYGGVVPELASRDHVRHLLPLVRKVMQDAGAEVQDIEGLAWTSGPGLAGSLLVGAALGQSLAWAWGIPGLGVHHMEGHLLAPMLEADPPAFPFLALLVSGGHTLLVEVQGIGQYKVLGYSLDDAVGEAFDKTAKLLDLGYPGGPALAEAARHGTPGRFTLPRPMVDRPGLDFSFSGLKTAVLQCWQQQEPDSQCRADLALAFEEAVVETLMIKCRRAIREVGIRRLVVSGGVGANMRLRQRLHELVDAEACTLHFPRPEFCTDNGAMIAYAGHCRLSAGQRSNHAICARARWPLDELLPLAAAPHH